MVGGLLRSHEVTWTAFSLRVSGSKSGAESGGVGGNSAARRAIHGHRIIGRQSVDGEPRWRKLII
ncbi:hypothetical protein KCH_61800 [Kitasatospora cheerisanensis KCTC 2395]|uniref:Uncharacterized protein n=1 Tax=Kitasatospora cheerisanensis KCTC 2395 TaxID=1348663 RepID=A0A066YVA8_9ACTN|nr:hypothetical protein KCH_61800 [Kitasatospora cheerisanensis KCTC 2395]